MVESCPECARHPVEIDAHWHGSSVRLVGCKDHTAQLSQVLADIQTLSRLPFNAGEIDGILDKYNWLKVLPKPMRGPFERLCTEVGRVAAIYEALRIAVRGHPQKVDDKKPYGGGERTN